MADKVTLEGLKKKYGIDQARTEAARQPSGGGSSVSTKSSGGRQDNKVTLDSLRKKYGRTQGQFSAGTPSASGAAKPGKVTLESLREKYGIGSHSAAGTQGNDVWDAQRRFIESFLTDSKKIPVRCQRRAESALLQPGRADLCDKGQDAFRPGGHGGFLSEPKQGTPGAGAVQGTDRLRPVLPFCPL